MSNNTQQWLQRLSVFFYKAIPQVLFSFFTSLLEQVGNYNKHQSILHITFGELIGLVVGFMHMQWYIQNNEKLNI